MKLLLVDDSKLDIARATDIIAPWGYEISVAQNGQEAFEWMLEQSGPVLALIDWVMPVMDGIELCQRLQTAPNRQAMYIVMLTSKNNKDEITTALDAGADDYIVKPFHPKELQSRLKSGKRMLKYQFTLEKIIEELVQANKELNRRGSIDGLTGLNNRRYFDERYRDEFRRASREKLPLSIIMGDVDFFKKYNDTYGHLQGDDCLRKVSDVMSGIVTRAGDLLARYGGEEFVVMLPNTDTIGATVVAESIRTGVKRLAIPHSGSPYGTVTMSLGLTTVVPEYGDDPDEIISKADKALYSAKAAGRDVVHQAL